MSDSKRESERRQRKDVNIKLKIKIQFSLLNTFYKIHKY